LCVCCADQCSQYREQSDVVLDFQKRDVTGAGLDLDPDLELDLNREPECIIGSTDQHGELMFLVKWCGTFHLPFCIKLE
jgi:hypothetical protein